MTVVERLLYAALIPVWCACAAGTAAWVAAHWLTGGWRGGARW